MSALTKRLLHWVGSLLALFGVVFVGVRLTNYNSQFDFSRFDSYMWLIVILLAVIYGLANIALALAWRDFLKYFGAVTRKLWAIRIYGLTQLAKYVPGNIFHLASRQALGVSFGVSGKTLIKASVWELGLISIIGTIFSILILPLFFPFFTSLLSIVSFIMVLIVTGLGFNRYFGLAVSRAVCWYMLFLSISGTVFVGILLLLNESDVIAVSQFFIICGAFILAWLVGLITPGAPAGVGVREAILVMLLKGVVNESDLLLAIVLSRVITVGGDILFFILAFFITDRSEIARMKS